MRRMRASATMAAVQAAVLISTVSFTPVLAREAFPEASPESQGMSSEALAKLADTVGDYIDRDMAVGAELLVIKDRHTVLHETFGLRDREAEIPMERNTLFNIRSMTKPLTGAAIQALIDDGALALDDRAADYLPGFDTDASRDITVEQLLTHQSGLPLTILTATDEFMSLDDMGNAIGEIGPKFEPGSKFWYSDAGADALGAIVEQASGSSLEDVVTERLLGPLGMEDTYYVGDPVDPRLDRTANLYVGRPGGWTRFWSPEEEPFYPYAWGSQSLYSTPMDYARFLAMWMDGGVSGDAEVLSPEAVARTLTPVAPMGQLGSDAPYPTLFEDLTVYHGQMALMHIDGEPVDGAPPPGAEASAYGYSGSDGTIAWAWPERDLIILYFTQSRGGLTPLRLEAEIERLLLDPPVGPVAEIPVAYGDYLGTYTADFEQFRNEPFEVLWRDDELALDIPSLFIFTLERVGADEERWMVSGMPGVEVSFARDESGAVTDLRIHEGGEVRELPKGEPPAEPETTLRSEDVAQYPGWFRETGTDREVEVVFQDGTLALRVPETTEPLGLYPPDADGVWRLRLNPALEIVFDEDDGEVSGYTVRGPGGEATFERIEGPSPQDDG